MQQGLHKSEYYYGSTQLSSETGTGGAADAGLNEEDEEEEEEEEYDEDSGVNSGLITNWSSVKMFGGAGGAGREQGVDEDEDEDEDEDMGAGINDGLIGNYSAVKMFGGGWNGSEEEGEEDEEEDEDSGPGINDGLIGNWSSVKMFGGAGGAGQEPEGVEDEDEEMGAGINDGLIGNYSAVKMFGGGGGSEDEKTEDEEEEDDSGPGLNDGLITNWSSVKMFRDGEGGGTGGVEEQDGLIGNRSAVKMFREDGFGGQKRKREAEVLPSNTRVKVEVERKGGKKTAFEERKERKRRVNAFVARRATGVVGAAAPEIIAPEVVVALPSVVVETGRGAQEIKKKVGRHPGASPGKPVRAGRGAEKKRGGVLSGRVEKPVTVSGGRRLVAKELPARGVRGELDALRGYAELVAGVGAEIVGRGVNMLAGVCSSFLWFLSNLNFN